MKKLLIAAAAASMLLASCASNGEAKKDAEVPAPEHPMTYVLDLADTGDSVTFVDNTQYGESGKSTRQAKPSWTKLVKQNKVKAGDTVSSIADNNKLSIGCPLSGNSQAPPTVRGCSCHPECPLEFPWNPF